MSGANRFGDLAIWEEILKFLATTAPDTKAVVIITHDTKPDWSYTPNRIVDSDGHTKPNPQRGPAQLSVAQPMLVHELTKRTGAAALYIITVPQLAVIANGHVVGFRFTELARAVQVEADDDLPSDQQTAEMDIGREAGGQGDEAPALGAEAHQDPPRGLGADAFQAEGALEGFLANPPAEALADQDYTGDPAGLADFDATIQGLRSNNWYLQNPAVREAVGFLTEGRATLLQAFVFGRNLYQAAVGTAAEATRLLEELPAKAAQFPLPLANAVYAGALFEAYFDREGSLRHVPKDGQLDPLLRHQTTAMLEPAISFIRQRLEGAHLLLIPSVDAPTVHLTIDFDGPVISAVKLGETPITCPHDGTNIAASPLPEKVTWKRLMTLISGHFTIPEQQLDLQPMFEEVMDVAKLQFIEWNPVDGPDLGG